MPPDPPKPGATRRPASLREAFAYLDWLFNPFSRIETTRVYDLLSTRAATRDGLYLNLGYWREARQLDEACDALAALVAETGGMGPGDEVLDVGYGFGDQDLYWMRRYRPGADHRTQHHREPGAGRPGPHAGGGARGSDRSAPGQRHLHAASPTPPATW